MMLLVIGLLLFVGAHLMIALAPDFRRKCHARLGEMGYKGGFSLLLGVAIALIIFGWRSLPSQPLYAVSTSFHAPALALLFAAFLLLVVSNRQSRLRLLIRHPQLTGVALWGSAHLLLNGDVRSTVLFGVLTVWAITEIVLINRREGVWIKEAVPGWGTELVTLVITAVTIAAVIAIHPWIAGVPVH